MAVHLGGDSWPVPRASAMDEAVRIGTSGWTYKHWRGVFYPEGLPQARWLEHYARYFDTVEINFSFYRLPTFQAFQRWYQRTPPRFCFAVKASRYITHVKRLKDPQESMDRFFERVRGLGHKAGPILWQLPPGLHRDDERLEAFAMALPRAYRHAFEFRHSSWFHESVYRIMEQYGLALVIADHVASPLPRLRRLTANWTYLRFHWGEESGSYSEAQLQSWAGEIRRFREQGADVFAYFNNDPYGYAVRNALRLKEILGSSMWPYEPAGAPSPHAG